MAAMSSPKSHHLHLIALAVLVQMLSGCESKSGFFRADNLFAAETEAIGKWLDPAKRDQDSKEKGRRGRDDDNRRGSDSGTTVDPYFGRAEPASPLAALAKPEKKSPLSRKKGSEPVVEESISDQGSIETAPTSQSSAAPTGGVCYRCNGKGERLSGFSRDAEFITCEACGGSGRR